MKLQKSNLNPKKFKILLKDSMVLKIYYLSIFAKITENF